VARAAVVTVQKAGGSRGGGRYIKRGAAQQVAVTETGRLSRRPLHKAGGGSAGGRYRNRAAQQAAVTEIGRLSRRLQEAGGRYRRPLREAAGRYRRPLQEQCPGAGCPYMYVGPLPYSYFNIILGVLGSGTGIIPGTRTS
jgi:hypothetical protein